MKPSLETHLYDANAVHPCRRFHSQLLGALQALQSMQDRTDVEAPLPNQWTRRGRCPPLADADIDELMNALSNGGIWLTVGEFSVMVFKRPWEKPSCQRR